MRFVHSRRSTWVGKKAGSRGEKTDTSTPEATGFAVRLILADELRSHESRASTAILLTSVATTRLSGSDEAPMRQESRPGRRAATPTTRVSEGSKQSVAAVTSRAPRSYPELILPRANDARCSSSTR